MERKAFSLLVGLGLILCLSGAQTGFSASTPARQKIDKTVNETVAVQQKTAALRQAWQVEQRTLADTTHALELEIKLLEARREKLAGYSKQRRSEIARLQAGLAEMTEIGLKLEPFLDDLVDRLEDFKNTDLPFAEAERERRLADLRLALNRYDADLAEKLRRVMEVLKIEAGFGRGFEVSEESLSINGVETTVRMLRLGRVGLYYLSLDGDQAGWFNRATGEWEILPGSYHEAVKEALRMALKQRAFDLVRLPVAGGRP